jgi:ATP phosphoribosyltransferase
MTSTADCRDNRMLRVAVPNKGMMSEPARAMLQEAGYLRSASVRDLLVHDPAIYVGEGTLDLGITGRDMLLDSGAQADEILDLGFAPSTFRLAAPAGAGWTPADLDGRTIATSYAGVLEAWLARTGISARVVKLDGAVENAVALGVADAVADVVATGTTLKRAGLEIIGEPILTSEALVVRRRGAAHVPAVETFVRRLHGVMVARSYVLVDYDIRTERAHPGHRIADGLVAA